MAEFPYVRMCPDCGGKGQHWHEGERLEAWGGEIVRILPISRRCFTCNGRGGIIPPEWTQDGAT